ncbi:hypothetical protein GIB67_042473 [Kingdonia uniflora]|uniref:TF-B3 domain-containing protein n=1 Tax=Kingdonia uniflora TaxID=39325 RepID=A0A7J7M139_9MAGN|nr:hypothetical protein GIB67_042473 [Kingdonia uniflora]
MEPKEMDVDIDKLMGSPQEMTSASVKEEIEEGEEFGPEHLKNNAPNDKDIMPEEQDNEVYWLSDKPYFHIILGPSHVRSPYRVTPQKKMQQLLPQAKVPLILTYQNKNWKTTYEKFRTAKQFSFTWKHFVIDNNLKLGDACVFELTECSGQCVRFRLQILSGDIPPEFADRIDGNTPSVPIVIE